MKKQNKTPPVFDQLGRPNTKRYLIRDLDDRQCSDWIADVWPERKTIACDGFPFRLVRRWNFDEELAAINESARQNGTSLEEALARWSEHQAEILGHEQGHPVVLVPIDRLHFDLGQQRWWKTEDASRLHQLFSALRESDDSSWMHLAGELVMFEPQKRWYLHSLVTKLSAFGLPLDPSPSSLEPDDRCARLITRLQPQEREPLHGYWHIQHALLPVVELVSALEWEPDIAETARVVAGHDAPPESPLAYTRLVRPRHEWVTPLVRHAKWPDDEIIARAKVLSFLLKHAGLRPLTSQPPPVVSIRLPLQCFGVLVGNGRLDPVKIRLLVGGGIETVGDLITTEPRNLVRHAPIMPSDLRAFARVLAAFGYHYPYLENDLASAASR